MFGTCPPRCFQIIEERDDHHGRQDRQDAYQIFQAGSWRGMGELWLVGGDWWLEHDFFLLICSDL